MRDSKPWMACVAALAALASAGCDGDSEPDEETCGARCDDGEPGLPHYPDPTLADHIATYIAGHERVPDSGVAVAVIHDGAVVHLGAYGERDRAGGKPVTPRTLFGIGSSSKPFAGATAVIQAQAGALDVDAPVRDHAPDFALADDAVSDQTSLADLLSHRTGLSSNNSLFFLTSLDRAGLFASLRHLDLTTAFRERIQYNNLGIVAAAVVQERVAGEPWEELARRSVLEPLGMTTTVFTRDGYLAAADHAIGYRGLEPMQLTEIDRVGPAGSMGASIEDMARWSWFLINGGVAPDRTVVVEPEWFERWIEPVVEFGRLPDRHADYALAWMVTRHDNGDVIVEHEGGAAGFLSHVSFRPATGDAVVVLSNQHGTTLSTALAEEIYAYLADRPAFETPVREVLEPFEPVLVLGDTERPAAALDPAQLVGSYEHPAYGRIDVDAGDTGLIARHEDDVWPLFTLDGISYFFTTELWLDEPYTFEVAFAPSTADSAAPAAELRIPLNFGFLGFEFRTHPAIRFARPGR